MADSSPEPPRPEATLPFVPGEVASDAPTLIDLENQPGWVLAWEDGSPLPTAGELPRYELRSELARGGLGRVHFAWDRRLARAVAIKEPLTEGARARFYREALLTARLQHPGIVPIYDAGNGEGGAPFYAMRLLGEGRSFSAAIAAAPDLEERLTLLPHVIAAADAVAYAHSQRIIHRDLKPDNILLGPFGETVVIDWGLAKDLAAEEPAAPPAGEPGSGGAPRLAPAAAGFTPSPSPGFATPLTVAGTTVGTPAYMSPEQVFQGPVDERTDVYSLGTVLLELLVGKRGAPAGRLAIASAAAWRQMLPGVPADLVAILRTAMAEEPADRYPTARELAADLRRFAAGQLVKAHVYSPLTLAARWLGRHRWPVGIAALSLLLLAIAGVAGVRRVILERNRAEAARARAEERNDALTLVQARTSLDRDPTAALAWLATYREEAAHQDLWRSLLADAAARGVARHILPFTDRVRALAFARDGRLLVAADYARKLRLFDTREGRLLGEWERPGGTNVLAVLADPRPSGDAGIGGDPRAGLRVLTGGPDGRLLLCDLATGATRAFAGHSAVITALEVLRDRRTSISSSRDGTVYAFDLESGAGRLLTRHQGAVTSVVVGPDQRFAFSAGRDGELHWIDLAGGAPPRVVATGSPVAAVAVSPASSAARPLAATAGDDFRVRLWDLAAGSSRIVAEHEGIVAAIAFSPDGRLLASASRDRSVQVTALDPRDAALTRTYTGHSDDLETLRFSPDGSRLASAGLDGTIRVIELASGRQRVLGGSRLMIEKLEFSPDGEWLAAGTQDQDVRIWHDRREPENVLAGHGNDVDALLFLPPAAPGGPPAALVSTGHDRDLRLWPYHPETQAFGPDSRVLAGHQGTVDQLALLPDGRLLSGSGDQLLRIWDLASGRSRELAGHGHAISGVLAADGGRVAISASLDGTVRVWDLGSAGGGVLRHVLAGHQGAVLAIALSPDGKVLASGGADRSVRLWDWRAGRELARLDGHDDQVGVLGFSPDGTRLASGAWNGGVRLWQGEGWKESRRLDGHSERVRCLLFSPDGRILATSSIDHDIRLWNPENGAVRVLRGHQASVRHLAFSPDGRRLSSSSTDRTARLWDVASGELVALRRFEGIVTVSAFSADGRFLAVGGWDKLVHVYPAWAADLLPTGPGSGRRAIAELSTVSTDQDGKLASRPRPPS